jgi:hypothetical protein
MTSDLGVRIEAAKKAKPKYNEPCNHCGWCCLTEVCQLGIFHGDTSMIPCQFLIVAGGIHLCRLITDEIEQEKTLYIGRGCDAQTQEERIAQQGIEVKLRTTGED